MDRESILKRVWKHSGIKGAVWMPTIENIGTEQERFKDGSYTLSTNPSFPDFDPSADWYFTPGVSKQKTRKKSGFPAQRVAWVDCDDDYDKELLLKLKPTYAWETSPGHMQAVWLLQDSLSPSEYHRNGFMGMLTQAVGADKSGVDIGQLLRVPATMHNKREPYQGKILVSGGPIMSTGQLLTRVAKGLGFKPGLASELGAEDPYGDRSKKLWQFARNASELGLPQDLTFKLINACKWNKWKDQPESLKEDIAKAYEQEPEEKFKKSAELATPQADDEEPEEASWELQTPREFGKALRSPIRWILPDIIPQSGCGIIVSAPKVGKTRVSMEIALGISTGVAPLGKSVYKKRNVGFFSLEDGDHLFSERLSQYLGNDPARNKYHWDGHLTTGLKWYPPKEFPFHVGFSSMNLTDDVQMEKLQETIIEYNLEFVVIDTFSMAMGNADISSSKEVYGLLKTLKEIAKATRCAIMLIHHTRKRVFDKGESIQEMILGSTAIHAWSDFIIGLTKDEESSCLKMMVQTKRATTTQFITNEMKLVGSPPEKPDEDK